MMLPLVRVLLVVLPLLAVFVAACGSTATQTTAPTSAPAPTTAPTAAAKAAASPSPAAAAASPASSPAAAASPKPAASPAASPAAAAPAAAGTVRLNLVPNGSEARFRAREQLARLPAPSDAIGTTREVSGSVTVGPNGIVAEASKITVGLESLATDSGMRDRFIKTNTLQTSQFPTAEFTPRQATGLAWPLPTSGESNFQLSGDLTIHGVTAPATWDIRATFAPGEVSGLGTTTVTLDKFGMEKPSVASVLSIEDNIVLEIDFRAAQ